MIDFDCARFVRKASPWIRHCRATLMFVTLGLLLGAEAAGAQCVAVSCDIPVTDMIEDSLDTDCFTFAVDGEERVNIGVQEALAGTIDPVWRLLDKTGTPVPGCGSFFRSFGSDCGPLLPEGSPYRIDVLDQGVNATGAYRVSLARLTVPCDAVALPCDEVLDATIANPIEHDFYSFSVQDGELVNIGVQEAGPNTDVVWRLLDKTGTPAGGACGGFRRSFGGDCGPLTAAGSPYRINVLDDGVNATGAYRVSLARLTVPCDAVALPCDEVLDATIANPIEHDFYSFTVTQDGQRVNISVQESGSGVDPVWRLLDRRGVGVPGPCAGFIRSFGTDCGALLASGSPYRIDVLDNNVDATGPYRVRYAPLIGICPTPAPMSPTSTLTITPTRTITRTPTRSHTSTPTPTQHGGSCCSAHAGAGCELLACEACVCQLGAVPGCCTGGWDTLCEQVANNECAASCGCATPTRTSTPTATPTPTAGVDLVADAIEVVQAVQDLENGVRLVAGKRTFVRFHVHASSGESETTARLTVEHAGLPPVELVPLSLGGQITVRQAPDRAVPEHAFLFALPSEYLSGRLNLTAELNPDGAPVEHSAANNALSTSVEFEAVPEQTIVLYNVIYEQGGTLHFPTQADRVQMVVWLRRAFPLSELHIIERSYFAGAGVPSCGEVNTYLAGKRLWDLAFGDEVPLNARYYGMIDDGGGFSPGCALNVPSFVASGPSGPPGVDFTWDTDGSYGDWYGGHELAHAWGQFDAPFCGAEVDDGEPGFPNPEGRISNALVGPQAVYGFDIVSQAIYEPIWKDVMSFCPYQWISDHTHHGLLDFYRNETVDDRRDVDRRDRILVVGTIDPASDTARLEPLFVLPDTGDLEVREPGPYSIVLRNAGGGELARYPFTPERGAAGAGGVLARQVEVLFINELVPFVDGTSQVAIEGPGGLGEQVSAGPGAPTIRVIAPAAGQVVGGDTVVVQWSASDPDGDPLRYDVQFSRDAGQSWEMVEQHIDQTSVEIPATNIRRGDEAMFRVWASDGINTASADSASFRVPNRMPRVHITEPDDGKTIMVGQTLVLGAEAYDDDSGSLTGNQVRWTSSIDGQLGRGTTLSTARLVRGSHTIRVEADDGEGGVADAAVQIEVVELTKCPNPPDLLSVSPSLIRFEPDSLTASTIWIDNQNCRSPIRWAAVTGAAWVRLSQTQGGMPAAITASYDDTAGLAPGTHLATIVVSSPDDPGRELRVGVEVTVESTDPTCFGDCDGMSEVNVNELILMVNIALGNSSLSVCPVGDSDGDGMIGINDLIAAVNNSLNGCPRIQ